MKKLYFHIITFWVAAILIASCSKGDDGNNENNDPDGGNSTVFLQEVEYALTVSSQFTEADVAKPLVMDVSGKNVSGQLTLKDVNGRFSGTLMAPASAADSLQLTGTIEIPAAGNDDDDRSVVSLDDLMKKCGHKYTVSFKYNIDEPAVMTDSKAYFHFKMSPLQHRLFINSHQYQLSKNGELWMALDGRSSIVTNFYRKTNNEVVADSLYTIDCSGLVDLGIPNVLWADRNVGAVNCEDAGDYYAWEDVGSCVTEPLSAPVRGLTSKVGSDFYDLCSNTNHFWGTYHGVDGAFFFMPGCSDSLRDPFIFLPAAGAQKSSVFSYGEIGMYWTASSYDGRGYRLFFNSQRFSYDSYVVKNTGNMPVRAVWRYNHGGEYSETQKEKNDQPKELKPFFPEDYSLDDVLSWYTYKDEETMEEWALYLLKNNTYVLTQYIARTDAKVIQNVGDFVIEGDVDAAYKNFDMTATVWRIQKNVQFRNGKCNFMKKTFSQESSEKPLVAACTKNNSGTSIIFWPWAEDNGLQIDDVVGWYKQIDPRDEEEDFMIILLFRRGNYSLIRCWMKDGVQSGSEIMWAGFEVDDISDLDCNNFELEYHVVATGYVYYHQMMNVEDGVCSITGYNEKWKLQDLSLLRQLLGKQ